MRLVLVFFFIVLSSLVVQAQQQPAMTRTQLESKKKEIQDAIKDIEGQLQAVKNDKKATMTQLHVLQDKLAVRQRLIGNINEEIDDIDNNIQSSSHEVETLKQKLESLKVQYAQSVRYDYETRSSIGVIAFLFSSNDFNDALRRMKYLKKFRDFRKLQVDLIHHTQNELKHKIGVLNSQKKEKDELLNEQVQQKQVLTKETSEKNQVIQELKGHENELLKEIEKNRKTAAKINKAINEIIVREMAKAEEKAKKEKEHPQPSKVTPTPIVKNTNPTKPSVKNTEPEPLMLTPTDIALANNFDGNKGKLYWPVEKGFISDHFGPHPSPLAAKVIIDNNGIDIRTAQNASVRAVFDGTVSSIFSVDGRQVVMIQHGNFFTVYNGLASKSVSKGDFVKTLQQIGTVAENDEGEPTINFQIWKSAGKKGQVKLNPEQWISRIH